ncbi:hypothetical protein TCAL_02876 [Tigriopus californicus]|uniref:Citrate transporter-like domain-containing protein n=1 Tax=Tigriopus californicus TaxID=6832 RepID=A0A553NX86_TIGCA|nr:P protein-like [Tigriopus californicus]TRY70042.1 hypothetical protein TCAL_02876 [Tigriopus californicus]|eukprot:TCALIF_02876-PA protein Name:"Similar to Oca2 P protein (Sus scrofa)" AED:0.05 eAED:0.05 QI:0/-1/0/1/-1/1/1/0/732
MSGHIFENDLDGSWNAERIPLLQRTENDARYRGAKRQLSTLSPLNNNVSLTSSQTSIASKWSWQRSLKVSFLAFICLVLVVCLLFLPEESINTTIIDVTHDEPKRIDLDRRYHEKGSVSEKILRVTLKGSFVADELVPLVKDKVVIIAKKDYANYSDTTTQTWELGLMPEKVSNYFYLAQTVERHIFDLDGFDLESENVSLFISTTADHSVALAVTIELLSTLVDLGVMMGGVVLVVMYVFIIFELVHRTVVSMLAATAAIAILALLNERPTLMEIMSWIDIETLTLLFSMMIIVGIISETGVFSYLGYLAYRITRGQIWPLIIILCLLTALVSAVLDNVTTILLMTPVIIQLCESMNIDPTKVLIANVIFSNIGGASTAIGDPPNVLIASNPSIQERGVTFLTFTAHMTLCTVVVFVLSLGFLRLLYGKMEASKNENQDIKDLKHEIKIWKRTAQGMPNYTREEAQVKTAIELKIQELKEHLLERESRTSLFSAYITSRGLDELRENCRITDKWLLVKSSIVMILTIGLFFMENFPQFNLSLGWTAFLGALTLLIISDKAEVESVFARVEWSTLIFFATLFVVMEALDKLGLLRWIGGLVEQVITIVPPEHQLLVAITIILWVSGLASAFIDNIPFTTMMIPVITRLANSSNLELPIQPLVWSLALGACLGGNGTLIGASANVVCAGVAEQHGYKFTFMDFFKVGFPIMLLSLVVANLYLILCHVLFQWNG